jgi:hypothetical protein
MTSVIDVLTAVEADCIGIDTRATWQLHGSVVSAADKALARHVKATNEPSAPKDVAFGAAAYTSKQSRPVDTMELHAARAILEELVAGDGSVYGVPSEYATVVVDRSLSFMMDRWAEHCTCAAPQKSPGGRGAGVGVGSGSGSGQGLR